jgi:single-strand DNA-binding protein
VTWRQLAEICERYLHKSKVYIEGRLTQRKYTDREGVQRIAVDVIASDMKMLDRKPAEELAISEEAGIDLFLPGFPEDGK